MVVSGSSAWAAQFVFLMCEDQAGSILERRRKELNGTCRTDGTGGTKLNRSQVALRKAEVFGGFGKCLADDGAGFGWVVELGEDGEADVFRRIGNDADDECDASFCAEVHDFGDFRSAFDGHGIEGGEVGEDVEAGLEVGKEGGDVAGVLEDLVNFDAACESEDEELFYFVGGDENHFGEIDSGRMGVAQWECEGGEGCMARKELRDIEVCWRQAGGWRLKVKSEPRHLGCYDFGCEA